MIDSIIFDFDGVIIDTETPDYETWQDVFVAHGVELDRVLWGQFIGGGFGHFDMYNHLEELAGSRIDRETIRNDRRKRFMARIAENPVLPGVLQYITSAKELGLRIAVASSSDRAWVEGHLRDRGLLHHFDAIRTKDEVSQVKPHPELYLSAVSHLKSEPHRAIAIEDSANGVTAAKNAGLFCVVVPNPMTRSLSLDHADMQLGSLAELSLSDLLEMAVRG